MGLDVIHSYPIGFLGILLPQILALDLVQDGELLG